MTFFSHSYPLLRLPTSGHFRHKKNKFHLGVIPYPDGVTRGDLAPPLS